MRQWAAENWKLLPLFILMAVCVFALLRLQSSLRDRSAKEIERLLLVNPALCAERLENNRLFKTVFRRPVIELWKLQVYMQLGDDEKIENTIARLNGLKLEPRDKLELWQQSLSYYAVAGRKDEALAAANNLRRFITKAKLQETEPYASILEETETIVAVYIDKNTALIKKLIGRAEHTKDNITRGIIQFRIAKLAWFKKDFELMNTYLNRADKNLKNTAYSEIIAAAKTDPSILEIK